MTTSVAAADRVAVALDVPQAADAIDLAQQLSGEVGFFKIGLELFTAHGPDVVAAVRPYGKIFLDLKLHDIPTTVGRAAQRVAALDVDLVTVHALGGPAMVAAAAQALGSSKVLAVTVLTSMALSDLEAVGLSSDEPVARLAAMAVTAGAGGLVCSVAQLGVVRNAVGARPTVVTPGIRPAESGHDDHATAATPDAAMAAGADLLVVGRPITRANDPAAAARHIVASLGDRTS